MARKRIGDLLLEAGLLTPDQLESALGEQRRTKERLGDVLIRMGYVTESRLIEVLEFQLGIPHVALSQQRIDPSVLPLVPQAMARRHVVFPLRKERSRLVVAMSDPLDHYALEDLRMVSGLSVFPVIAAKDDLLSFIDRYYGMQGSVEDVLESMHAGEVDPNPAELTDESAPVVRLVNQILQRAAAARASDVHLDPEPGGLRVRFRVDGRLRDEQTLPKHLQGVVTARVKIMAGLNIAEHRLPQDGRFRLRGGGLDVRASTLPTVHGEKTVLRILDGSSGLLSLDRLGFSAEHLRTFTDLFRSDSGMVLITGPTGSGKTTTMYAALLEKSSAQMNVITVEDPVEYELPGINQVSVNAAAGMTFARGLRAILRQDPDVIMVGEIRDAETAEMAVRAALTGHFVFSTLHTRDAAATVARLMDMGVEPYRVAAALSGIVAQRLVRRVCRHCGRPGEPRGFEREALAARGLSPEGLLFGAGCSECGQTGYLGRVAVYEVLRVDETLRGMIGRGAEESELRGRIRSQGFRSLYDDALAKAASGTTTVSEALRVAWSDGENG